MIYNEIMHYGTKRKSGRYPFGSGRRPYQRNSSFSHKQFEEVERQIIKKASNDYKKFEKQPMNISDVKSRSGIEDKYIDDVVNLANKKFYEAYKVEPQITRDIVDIVKSSNSKMYGLEYRLKQPTSIAGKIGKDSKEESITFKEAASGIRDVVRYTILFEPDNFVENYQKIKNSLEKMGYSETRLKNYFDKYKNGESMHKSVQSNYRNPVGYEFEIQFQTPSSQAAKELKIPIYEERRKSNVSHERAIELEKQMRELADMVIDPPKIDKIKHSIDEIIKHHGRKGQQWGVSNGPPYPLNKKGLSYYFSKRKITKEDRQRIKDEEAAKKRQAYEERLEKNKDKVLKSGKASEILQYQGRLTNQELQNAVSRLNLEKSLKEFSSKEKQSSIKKVDELMSTVDTAVKWTNTGIKAWNTFAGTYNSLSDSPNKLKTISLGDGGNKKKK